MRSIKLVTLCLLLPAGLVLAASPSVTLEQWYHAYGEKGTHEAVLRYADDYGKASGNKVNVTWVLGQGAYGPKLNTALLGTGGPDIYENTNISVSAIKAGQIAPLDELFTPAVRADFDPRALSENTYNGHIYAVKMLTDTGVLYYRKSLLAKAGIKPPTTFAELVAASKKLTGGGVKGLFIGNDGGTTALERLLPWSAGADFIKGNKVVFDTPRTVAALQGLRDLNKSGALLTGSPTDWWDPSAFTQGLVAMQWCGLWAMPGIKEALGDDFGVMPLPAFDAKGTPVTVWAGWSAMVNGKSKNLAAAKAALKAMWIDNTKLQADWNTAYGFHVPPRKSAIAAAPKLRNGPAAETVTLLRKYGRAMPPTWNAAMDTAYEDATAKVVKTDQDIAGLVHQAALKAQAELDRELQ